jgi:iron(III) transport system substrate-binding protein
MACASIVAMLVAAGCSSGSSGSNSSSSPSSSQGAGVSAAPASSGSSGGSIAQLQSQAEKEGTVVWYTTVADREIKPIVSTFEKKYPKIKVQSLRLNAADIPSRVLTEQRGGKYAVDIISGNAPYLWQLKLAGALQPFDAPDQAPLPSGMGLPSGYHGVLYGVTNVISYNPQALKKLNLSPPTSWQDLTKPEWKGHFSMNPLDVGWYMAMIKEMGHSAAKQLVTDLGNNGPRIVTSHTLADTQVVSGEPAATANAYGYDAAHFVSTDPGKIVFFNGNPLPVEVVLVDLAKNAPHPAAAKIFDDWLESQEGQQTIADATNEVSLRSDVKNNPTVWNPSKWPPVFSPPTATPDEYNTDLKEYQVATHSTS